MLNGPLPARDGAGLDQKQSKMQKVELFDRTYESQP